MQSDAVMVEMIFPEQANHYGTLFGGNALSLMAKAAFVAATSYARMPVVMARSERVDFATPVKVGEILELRATVVRTGRTSMTVAVTGLARGIVGGVPRAVLTGRFEMVAVDGAGRPAAMAEEIQMKGRDHEDA